MIKYGNLGSAIFIKILEFFLNAVVRGAFNKFPDFFGMATFINRTLKKL